MINAEQLERACDPATPVLRNLEQRWSPFEEVRRDPDRLLVERQALWNDLVCPQSRGLWCGCQRLVRAAQGDAPPDYNLRREFRQLCDWLDDDRLDHSPREQLSAEELLTQKSLREALHSCLQNRMIRALLACTERLASPDVAMSRLEADVLADMAAELAHPFINESFLENVVFGLRHRRQRPGTRSCQVAFVTVRAIDRRPSLNWLRLERIPEGRRSVFLHPQQCLLAMRADFVDSLFSAASVAIRRTPDNQFSSDFDIRITFFDSEHRLLATPIELAPSTEDLEDAASAKQVPQLPYFSGPSASGAAAYALCHAFAQQVPDRRVLVLATADADGHLGPVNDIDLKIEAALGDQGVRESFDTIVVCAGRNADEAERALRSLKKEYVIVGSDEVATNADTIALVCLDAN